MSSRRPLCSVKKVRPQLVARHLAASSFLNSNALLPGDGPVVVDHLAHELPRDRDELGETIGTAHDIACPLNGGCLSHTRPVKHCDTDLSSIAHAELEQWNTAMLSDKTKKRRSSSSQWLAGKIAHAIKTNPEHMSDTEIGLRMGLDASTARQTVYSWKKTGRIDKSRLPLFAAIVRRPVMYFLEQNYPDRVLLPGEDVLPDAEVNTTEARLLVAFRDLTPEQQAEFLVHMENGATGNRRVLEHMQGRYPPALSVVNGAPIVKKPEPKKRLK